MITFVCHHLGNAGAERAMTNLIYYFHSQGYKIQAILLREDRIDYYIPSEVEICSLQWIKYKKLWLLIPRLKQLRKIIKGDIVISFPFPALFFTVLASLFKGKRVIVSERATPYLYPQGRIRQLLRTLSFYLADAIVFQTEEAKKYFPKKIRKKGVIIPNSIKDNLVLKKGTERKKRIVSACRLSPQKNIPMAIDAFAQFIREYPDYIYEIYGEGDLEQELDAYIASKSLQKKIILKGFSHNVHEEIKDAMMYISSSDYEGISNSMLEAMAIGLPVICTDCPAGGARQTITNGHDGILIPVGDTKALTDAMLKIAGDKEFRDRIAKNAMEVRERYKAESICQEWEKLIRRAF